MKHKSLKHNRSIIIRHRHENRQRQNKQSDICAVGNPIKRRASVQLADCYLWYLCNVITIKIDYDNHPFTVELDRFGTKPLIIRSKEEGTKITVFL